MARIGRMAVIVAVFVFMAFVALVGGAPAGASTFSDCDSLVVDQTSKKVLDTSKIESAVTAANKSGVDLYVRAFQKTPDGSLDQYWQDGVQKCANWRSGSGSDARPKGNVALVAFSFDPAHKSAVFYGPVYDDIIGDAGANKIRIGMNKFFANGDFTGGVTFAAGRIGSLAGGNALSPADQPAATSGADNAGLTITARIIFFGLIAAVIVTLFALAYVLIMKRVRQQRDKRAALARSKKDALDARKMVNGYVTKWSGDEIKLLDNDLELELLMLPESRQAKHRQDAKEIMAVFNSGMDEYGRMVQRAGDSIDAMAATAGDYDRAASRYGTINEIFKAGEEDLAEFREAVKSDVNALSPAKQSERAAENVLSINRMATRFDEFASVFSVNSEKDLATALSRGAVRTAEFARTKADPVKALEMIEADERKITELKNALSTVRADYARLKDPLATMQAIVNKGRSQVRQYSSSSDKAETDLQKVDDDLRSKLRFFGPDKDRKAELDVIERVQSQVDTIVRNAKKASDEDERKRRRDREVEVSRRRPSGSGRSSSGSISDSFMGGLGGGFIGGALGGGSVGSDTNNSSGGDWGGGSSGGFDGGGSSGGGDSGGW